MLCLHIFVLLASLTSFMARDSFALKPRPNVVLFLADDLGIGDIGCFGNTTIRTPNIDALCQYGVKLEHNLAPESICTPSRGAFLTGRYAVRLGLAAVEDDTRVIISNSASGGLQPDAVTFASLLKDAGYKTALFGKWHLGMNCSSGSEFCHHPLRHGFDYFYGVPLTNLRECKEDNHSSCFSFVISRGESIVILTLGMGLIVASLISKGNLQFFFYTVGTCMVIFSAVWLIYLRVVKTDVCMLMRNYTIVEQPSYSTDLTQRLASDAARYIQSATPGEPFLLLMSFLKVHTFLFTSAAFKKHSRHGEYGDNVEEMDWAVGIIMSALRQKGILNETFIYFTSDHGPDLEEVNEKGIIEGGSRGGFRGGKSTSWEGGIRVPTIAMWQGVWPAGKVVTQPTSSLDVFPTLTYLAGLNKSDELEPDGKNIFDLLSGGTELTPHDFIFHYCGAYVHAVTYIEKTKMTHVWKVHFMSAKWDDASQRCGIGSKGVQHCPCFGKGVTYHEPPLVYSMDEDPFEQSPVDPTNPKHYMVVLKVREALVVHAKSIKKFKYQLSRLRNSMRLTHLYCCNFPFCSCKEEFPYSLTAVNTSHTW